MPLAVGDVARQPVSMDADDNLAAAARRMLKRVILDRFPPGPEREVWLDWLARLKPWQIPPSLPGIDEPVESPTLH
jgi:hypothetical protein